MKTLILCVGFYSLGVFNCAVFAAVYLLHRPRYVAPPVTKHGRRGALPRTPKEPPPMPGCKPASKQCRACYGGDLPCVCQLPRKDAEVGGIRYEHLGMTGLEE